jgi:hypothetical protein
MEAQGEKMYSFYSFTTSALDGGELLASRPGRALPREKICLIWDSENVLPSDYGVGVLTAT